MHSTFRAELERCLRSIPRGRAATFGMVARALGDARAARAVWAWVREHPEVEGAHRLVHANGRPISESASRRLREEAVRMVGNRVDATVFQTEVPSTGFLESLRAEQRRLAAGVIEHGDLDATARVGGVDVSYDGDVGYAVATVFDANLTRLQTSEAVVRVEFPYIPTYLAFRELPAIAAAIERLDPPPDVLLIDGHGRLHPEGFGVACHAGLALGVPTIGVAKHRLVGRIGPSRARGDAAPVWIEADLRGYAWTPPGGSRPLFVSVGHRVGLETALDIARSTTRLRMPEPLRLADALARKRKNEEKRERGSNP